MCAQEGGYGLIVDSVRGFQLARSTYEGMASAMHCCSFLGTRRTIAYTSRGNWRGAPPMPTTAATNSLLTKLRFQTCKPRYSLLDVVGLTLLLGLIFGGLAVYQGRGYTKRLNKAVLQRS